MLVHPLALTSLVSLNQLKLQHTFNQKSLPNLRQHINNRNTTKHIKNASQTDHKKKNTTSAPEGHTPHISVSEMKGSKISTWTVKCTVAEVQRRCSSTIYLSLAPTIQKISPTHAGHTTPIDFANDEQEDQCEGNLMTGLRGLGVRRKSQYTELVVMSRKKKAQYNKNYTLNRKINEKK